MFQARSRQPDDAQAPAHVPLVIVVLQKRQESCLGGLHERGGLVQHRRGLLVVRAFLIFYETCLFG